MIKHLTIILIALIAISAAEEVPLDLPSATNAIKHLFVSGTDKIRIDEYKHKTGNKTHYNVRQIGKDGEDNRMHGLSFDVVQDRHLTKVRFFNHKKQPILKAMKGFYQKEWNSMAAAFNTLYLNIIDIDDELDSVDNTMYFNTFQDIRNAVEQSPEVGGKIQLKYEVEDNYSILRLRSEESQLASVKFEVIARAEKDIKEDTIDKHIIRVTVVPSIAEKVEPTLVEFEIITRNNSDFNAKIAAIIDAMRLKGFFNNNSENFDIIQGFFNSELDVKLKDVTDPKRDEKDKYNKQIEASFENNKLTGTLVYIEPHDDVAIGTYKLVLNYNGSKINDVEYHRMMKVQLIELLKSLNIKQHFKSIRDQIFAIFEAEVKEAYGEKLKSIKFGAGGSFMRSENGRSATHESGDIGEISYSDDRTDVSFAITMKKGANIKFDYKFIKSRFYYKIVKEVISVIVRGAALKQTKSEVL